MGEELLKRHLSRLGRALNVYFEEAEKFDTEAKSAWAKLPLRSLEDELREMENFIGEGKVKLMKVMRGGERVGVFGYAVIDAEEGKTLYIAGVSVEDQAQCSDWTDMLHCIDELVFKEGCEWVRCETSRAGMFRSLVDVGFKPACVELVAKTSDVVEKLKEMEGKNV